MAHGAACRLRTRDQQLADTLATNYRRAGLDQRERAMLDFAAKIAHSSDQIVGDDINALREVGWSDQAILHILEIAAMFSYTGRLANGLGLLANAEYSMLGRTTPVGGSEQ